MPIHDWKKLIDSWERNRPEEAPIQKAPKKENTRYGNFDVSEAFERALERSYGK